MIMNPVQSGGGSGGLHYTKVRAVKKDHFYPHFMYTALDGSEVEVTREVDRDIPCVDGSVRIGKAVDERSGLAALGNPYVTLTMEGDVLVLSTFVTSGLA